MEKMTKEEFVESCRRKGLEIPPNIEPVECNCETSFCPGWKFEFRRGDSPPEWKGNNIDCKD